MNRSPSMPEKETTARYRPAVAQINLFTGEVEPPVVTVDPEDQASEEISVDEGISLIKTEEGSQLILSGFGLFLSKKSERLVVRKSNQVLYQFPFFRLSEVVVGGKGIGISSDLIEELCARGIRMVFLSGLGKPYAMITSPTLTATVQTRRQQTAALDDARGFEFARAVVEGKIRNQERLLRYFGKYLKKSDATRFQTVERIASELRGLAESATGLSYPTIDQARASLMGLEGTAGRRYWEAVTEIISQKVEFLGREHVGATDAVNSLLNYGYGILYAQVWGAVINAGLEPFAGFLHVDRPGKPSLVLDLVEEFRQPVVDRVVISFLNLGTPVEMEAGMLKPETRHEEGTETQINQTHTLSSFQPHRGFPMRRELKQEAPDPGAGGVSEPHRGFPMRRELKRTPARWRADRGRLPHRGFPMRRELKPECVRLCRNWAESRTADSR